MQKLLGILVLIVLLGACKKAKEAPVEVNTEALEFNYQKMPEKFDINAEAAAIVADWPQFKDLNSSIDVLYKATNNEDLALAIDDLIEKEKKLAEAKYPELFDTYQIKSRQMVMRTFLYKVKASIMENQPTTAPAIKVLEAYNSMRKQLNVIMNSQLDKKLILDET
ncbi:hypothetical protein K1F50_09340 [Muricauda oceani]|uniref:Uncharacterized protein n=1 Tax=Flagellimonas oceani TaxID=2698672 RepID=A0A6G7J873_9FLAO|nr:hypothetical protein [Allomuricauda oceani]MBW8243002.1 hypothetical protein [Allomuricauda oceani]QII46642.1 hypothetical protein GVT53_18795 [Allomuricauda oceani]